MTKDIQLLWNYNFEIGFVLVAASLGLAYYFFVRETPSIKAPSKSSNTMASASSTSPAASVSRRAGRQASKPSNFTISQLSQYKGLEGRPIYLACNGVVFDMSSHESGPTFYGKGGPYEIFSGADASIGLALMSTDPATWTKSLVSELSASELDVMRDWYNRFLNKYIVVGALTEGSNPTTTEKLITEGVLV
jgi:predicted heme/steroid binding protein